MIRGMAILEDAADLLRGTEEKLRDMVSAAATSGDYASVLKIASWAQAITNLVGGRGAKLGPAVGGSLPNGNGKNAKEVTFPTRVTRRPGTESPQFFRHDDQLVRLAWSRGQHKEYIHKAPYSVLKALTEAMAKEGVDGRVFSTDNFLPLQEKPR